MIKNTYKILFPILISCFVFSQNKTLFGYIDSQVILTEFKDVMQVQAALEKEQKRLQTVYETKIIQLDSLNNVISTGSMFWSDQKKQEMNDQMIQKQKELEEWNRKHVGPEGSLYKLQNELMAPILKIIDKAITNVGQRLGYDYIFDAASGGIVYALDAYNLTKDVLDELNVISATPIDENSR